jgi:hypothetical protein
MKAFVLACALVLLALGLVGGCATTVAVPGPPPVPRYEVPAPSPGIQFVWIPGHWRHTRHGWNWVPGHWGKRPRYGAVWVPGEWVLARGRWVWRPGRWRY